VPCLPELRFDEWLQLMHMDQNVFARMDGPIEQGHGTLEGSDCSRDNGRPNALSLAETVELLVHGALAGAPRR
jgi:hypothetical protein